MFRRLGMANFGSVAADGGDIITITDQTIIADATRPNIDATSTVASVSYTLGANGGVVIQSTTVPDPESYTTLLDSSEWINNKVNAGLYSFKWTVTGTGGTSFNPPSSTVQDTWAELTTNRTFTFQSIRIQASGVGVTTGNRQVTISIALTTDTSTILDTALINLSATARRT